MGSTITPNDTKFWRDLAPKIIDRLNIDIEDSTKKFSILWDNCDIPKSLGCYMIGKDRSYLRVETTGQGDIQPMNTREGQIRKIISFILEEIGVN